MNRILAAFKAPKGKVAKLEHVHVTGGVNARGAQVDVQIGDRILRLDADSADALALELIRKADGARAMSEFPIPMGKADS